MAGIEGSQTYQSLRSCYTTALVQDQKNDHAQGYLNKAYSSRIMQLSSMLDTAHCARIYMFACSLQCTPAPTSSAWNLHVFWFQTSKIPPGALLSYMLPNNLHTMTRFVDEDESKSFSKRVHVHKIPVSRSKSRTCFGEWLSLIARPKIECQARAHVLTRRCISRWEQGLSISPAGYIYSAGLKLRGRLAGLQNLRSTQSAAERQR